MRRPMICVRVAFVACLLIQGGCESSSPEQGKNAGPRDKLRPHQTGLLQRRTDPPRENVFREPQNLSGAAPSTPPGSFVGVDSKTSDVVNPGELDIEQPRALPRDPEPRKRHIVQLTVHHVRVPRGTVSNDDEFWRRVNENHLPPASYRMLHRNGMRVGVAAKADWAYFKKLVDNHPVAGETRRLSSTGAQNIALNMKLKLPIQSIFYFDAGGMWGRTYDEADNLFALSFQMTPRENNSARIDLAPLIRSKRAEWRVTRNERVRNIKRVRPEFIYEVGLSTDVPVSRFLVVAPSKSANNRWTLGHAFLVHAGAARETESLLLLVPEVLTMTAQ